MGSWSSDWLPKRQDSWPDGVRSLGGVRLSSGSHGVDVALANAVGGTLPAMLAPLRLLPPPKTLREAPKLLTAPVSAGRIRGLRGGLGASTSSSGCSMWQAMPSAATWSARLLPCRLADWLLLRAMILTDLLS